MEWSFISAAVRRRLGLVIALAVLGALPGFLGLVSSGDSYQATATINVAAPTGNGAAAAANQPDRWVLSQLSVVQSIDTLDDAAATLGSDWTGAGIGSLINVEQEPETDLIHVTATAGDASTAALVANAVVDTYITESANRLREARQPAIDELQKRLDDITARLNGRAASEGVEAIVGINPQIADAMKGYIANASNPSYVIPQDSQIVPQFVQQRDQLLVEGDRIRSAISDIQLSAVSEATSSVIERATEPDGTTAGLGRYLTVAGLIFGGLVGTALALVIAQFSSKVLDEQVAENILRTNIVDSMPRSRAYAASPLRALTTSPPEMVETIERIGIRAEAMASSEIDQALTIAVLGTQPDSGTTTLTLALARRFAQVGYSVIVIDGDLNTRTISTLVEAEPNGGIKAVLRQTARNRPITDSVFTSTDLDKVRVLGTGSIDAHSSLRRDALGPILEAARSRAQVVLFDGGSLTGSSVSVFAARAADVVVLAVPLQSQDQRTLTEAAGLLPDDRSRVLAVVTAPGRRRVHEAPLPTVDDSDDSDELADVS